MKREFSREASRRDKDSLRTLVRALCADYGRRSKHIRAADTSRRVRMEHQYLNGRIFEAAAEICGSALAESFILEIGEERGYAGSDISVLSETAYKKYKAEIRLNIARKLHLAD